MVNKQFFIEDLIISTNKDNFDIMLKADNSMDVIGLFMFYVYTSKWQKTNIVKSTDKYTQNGLKVGVDRFRKAKTFLINNNLIEQIKRTDKNGKVTGFYIKINFLFSKEILSNLTSIAEEENHTSEKPLVDITTNGKQNTNALIYNNINTLNNNKEMLIGVKNENLNAFTLPFKRGKTSLERLKTIYYDLYYKHFELYPDNNSTIPKLYKVFKDLLQSYSEIQIAYLLIVFFTWRGMTGNDNKEFNFLVSSAFSVFLFKSNINKYIIFSKNIQSVEFDNDEVLLSDIKNYFLSTE